MKKIIEFAIIIATMALLSGCEASCNCGGNNYADASSAAQYETNV